jgi:hypothetical protein
MDLNKRTVIIIDLSQSFNDCLRYYSFNKEMIYDILNNILHLRDEHDPVIEELVELMIEKGMVENNVCEALVNAANVIENQIEYMSPGLFDLIEKNSFTSSIVHEKNLVLVIEPNHTTP